MHNWKTIQLDYVQEFPQAPIERELFMEIPKSFDVEKSDNSEICSQTQGKCIWAETSRTSVEQILSHEVDENRIFPSDINKCVFYKDGKIYVLYTDDSILTGRNHKQLL